MQDRPAGLCSRSVLPEATATYAGGSRLLPRMVEGVMCFVLASFRPFYSTSRRVCLRMCRNTGLALWTSLWGVWGKIASFEKWITLKFIFKLQIQYLHFYIPNKIIYQNTMNLELWSFGLTFPLCSVWKRVCRVSWNVTKSTRDFLVSQQNKLFWYVNEIHEDSLYLAGFLLPVTTESLKLVSPLPQLPGISPHSGTVITT